MRWRMSKDPIENNYEYCKCPDEIREVIFDIHSYMHALVTILGIILVMMINIFVVLLARLI